MDDRSMPPQAKAILSQPNPLEQVAAALDVMGPWRDWTYERQARHLRMLSGYEPELFEVLSLVDRKTILKIEDGGDFKMSTLIDLWYSLGYYPLIVPDHLGRQRVSHSGKYPGPTDQTWPRSLSYRWGLYHPLQKDSSRAK